jgi:glyoxylate reductase
MKDQGLEVVVNPHSTPLEYRDLKILAKNYDGLITMLSDRIDSAFLEENSHLMVIANYAVGFNNIDIKTAKALNIAVGNTPNVLTEATAEVALGLMISAGRQFHSSQMAARNGQFSGWDPMAYLGHGLAHKTLGIIGLGRIGKKVAEMATSAFKMKILYTSQTTTEDSHTAKKVDLETLLKESDFISLHIPLTPKTKKMISMKEFALMKKNAVLVNTARGEIIDQEALIYALKNQLIFAAGLDVTDPEPLPRDSELFCLPNALVLPHIGSATYESRKAMSVLAAENIIRGLAGMTLKAPVY